MPRFKIGDKVTLTNVEIDDSHYWLREGDVGEIVDIDKEDENSIQVSWYETSSGENDYWWVHPDCLTLFKKKEVLPIRERILNKIKFLDEQFKQRQEIKKEVDYEF